MTCQFCQTWNTDDDHRCRRCGRRIRSTPGRISPRTYPIAATATAPVIEFESAPQEQARAVHDQTAAPSLTPQPLLFESPVNVPRVISFDSITTPLEREAIHARAASLARPSPHPVEKVESTPRQKSRTSPTPRPNRHRTDQQSFDFIAQQDASTPAAPIPCDAPVATPGSRLTAATVDGAITLAGSMLALAAISVGTHALAFNKQSLLVAGLVVLIVSTAYRCLCISADRDSVGMSAAHLRLVDFDGRAPSPRVRYIRLFFSIISVLAVGLGVIWSLVGEERLAWHDLMSETFPTPEE